MSPNMSEIAIYVREPWQEVSMDFVTSLPESKTFDAIIVVVDHLTKMRHLIPCRTTTSSKDMTEFYVLNVWKLHGLPSHITSDRGAQFTAKFWKELCKHLIIEARMSTAFHPETDGQTERFNAVMEQYLRCYVSYQQDDWAEWLPIAEFAANNHVSSSTKLTLFFSNYGFHPRFSVTMNPFTKISPCINANNFATKMKKIYEYLRCNIRSAQDEQEQATNRHRKPAPVYHVGDQVFLSAQNVKTARYSNKLGWKKLGPFEIRRKISPHAYELNLPKSMKIHPIFHISLLYPAATDPVPGQLQKPPPPVIVDGVEEYEIEEIYNSRMHKQKGLQYLVKWVGENSATWEPATNLDETAAVDNFHNRYPNKPGPIK